MKLTAITIENFKGIRKPVRVELKPITLLFGPNSAGKSTILQALHYAREIFERQNLNPDRTLLGGDFVDLGGFESLVHNHDLGRPVTLRFDLDLTDEDLPNHDEARYIQDRDAPGSVGLKLSQVPTKITTMQVEVRLRWSEHMEQAYVEQYQVSANGHFLLAIRTSADGKSPRFDVNPYNPIFLSEDVTPEEAEKALFQVHEADDDTPQFKIGVLCWAWFELYQAFNGSGLYAFDIAEGLETALPGKDAAITFHFPEGGAPLAHQRDEGKDSHDLAYNLGLLLETLITGPCDCVRECLKRFCYVGPLRKVPPRGYHPVSSPDASRWADGLAAYDILFFSSRTFLDQVNKWLSGEERLNSGYRVKIKKYRELEEDHPLMLALLQGRFLDEDMNLRDLALALPVKRRLVLWEESRDLELAPQDIGVGISQVLPVVVAALHHKTGLVAIEQPELHIHPAFQVALGDLFIEQIREHPDLLFIIETHSEHTLLRLLRRIRETGENEAPANCALTPSELAIYFIEPGDDELVCTPIRVDEEGDFIDRWPRGFFNERARELF